MSTYPYWMKKATREVILLWADCTDKGDTWHECIRWRDFWSSSTTHTSTRYRSCYRAREHEQIWTGVFYPLRNSRGAVLYRRTCSMRECHPMRYHHELSMIAIWRDKRLLIWERARYRWHTYFFESESNRKKIILTNRKKILYSTSSHPRVPTWNVSARR